MDNKTQEIIQALAFLKQHSFEMYVSSNGNYICISFYRPNCCITYHEYLQFGDFNIFVSDSLEDFKNRKYRNVYGVDWLVDNVLCELKKENPEKEYSYLDVVRFYLIREIEKHHRVFDIVID